MKICIVNYTINNVGGINTFGEGLVEGFKRLGYDVPLYHCTAGVRYGCDPDKKVRYSQSDVLPGTFLSYNNKNLAKTLEVLNQYDQIIMLHASPHPTKDNLAKSDIYNWLELYGSTKAKKTVIFHDAMWEKTNPWFAEAADFVDLIFCGQKKFIHCANNYPSNCEKYWDFHPLDLQAAEKITSEHKKKKFGMMVMQWIKWKKHSDFIPQLDSVKTPMKLFNLGIEFWNLRKEGVLQKHIHNNYYHGEVWNTESIHNFYGYKSYEELSKYYAQAMFSIDTSIRGYMNYSHFEGLAFNTVPFIETRVSEDEDTVLPDDCSILFDLPTAADTINDFMQNRELINSTRENGRKFIQNFDCEKVAKRLLKKMQKL